MTIALKAAVLALALAATPALAQDKVKLITIAELSGPGATAGTNWKSGIELAVEEINAKGGILGRKIDLTAYDTQTNPANARAAVQRAIDEGTHAVLGPVYTGSIMASMQIAQRAEIAQLAAGDGTAYTAQGNPFIFRTSLSQSAAMPKIAAYLKDQVKAKSVAVVWVNNDFGKGGHEAILKELKSRGIAVPVDLSTEQGQADFAGEAIKVKNAAVDAVFVYLNEEESARLLVAMRDQNVGKPVIGETTILSQKVIELAGKAADGVRGHVGQTVDAPIPALQEFGKRFEARFKFVPDHNGIKGYMAVHAVKWATEKLGKFAPTKVAATLHGATIKPEEEPGILMETTFDAKGDVQRESFLAEVVDGKQKIIGRLPK